jgi:hypothetical protein
MKNEKGSAIAIVLLVLAVVSIVGAGLLLQSRYDEKITQAQKNYDRTFGLADGAASYAFPEILARDSVLYKGGPTVVWTRFLGPSGPSETAIALKVDIQGTTGKQVSVGTAVARIIIEGYNTDPQEMPGWELGTAEGYHVQFWVAEGTGKRESTESIPPETAVYMAAKKYAKN